jgi:hypothetical protein
MGTPHMDTAAVLSFSWLSWLVLQPSPVADLHYFTRISAKKITGSDCSRLKKASGIFRSIIALRW